VNELASVRSLLRAVASSEGATVSAPPDLQVRSEAAVAVGIAQLASEIDRAGEVVPSGRSIQVGDLLTTVDLVYRALVHAKEAEK